MKNRLLYVLFLIIAATSANAQLGFEMGLNMADLGIKYSDPVTNQATTLKTTYKPGFTIGFPVDFALGDHVYFEPGIFYDMTGAKLPGPPKGKYAISTMRFPLNFQYKTGEKCGSRFFIGIGPFINYNISGSVDYDANNNGIPATSYTIKFGTAKEDNMKTLDYGAAINLGYILRVRLYMRAKYQYGFANLDPASDGNNSIKSSGFSVTIGYLFGRCDSYRHIPGFKNTSGTHWRGMSKAKYSTKIRHPRY